MKKSVLLFSICLMIQIINAQNVLYSPNGFFSRNNNSNQKTFTVNGVSFKMVFVQGGTFIMGFTEGQYFNSNSFQELSCRVTLDNYYIGQTEVTQELWKAVMGNNPSEFKGDNHPVEMVSWNDCQTFIKKLNTLTGQKFALPTEAQWEFAARGGLKSQMYKYSGSNNVDNVAWYYGNAYYVDNRGPDFGTHPVSKKMGNELIIFDMSGNVAEWCQDWYDPNYYEKTTGNNPKGPSTGSSRVIRGGDWNWSMDYSCDLRVSNREHKDPDYRDKTLGFRLTLQMETNAETNNDLSNDRGDTNKTFTVKDVPFTMIFVKGGFFRMGEFSSENDSKPIHDVSLDSYYIGETEVTQELWKTVMGNNPSEFTSNNRRPVENVSWNDCQTFISKLNSLTGQKFRLPTEAEWEFAARGGVNSRGYKYSGSNTIQYISWYAVNSPISTTHPVGFRTGNELGIYDMSGNVSEWCKDRYDAYYYNSSPVINPKGPSSGGSRVIRGGSFHSNSLFYQVSTRDYSSPDNRRNYIGLRLAL